MAALTTCIDFKYVQRQKRKSNNILFNLYFKFIAISTFTGSLYRTEDDSRFRLTQGQIQVP